MSFVGFSKRGSAQVRLSHNLTAKDDLLKWWQKFDVLNGTMSPQFTVPQTKKTQSVNLESSNDELST